MKHLSKYVYQTEYDYHYNRTIEHLKYFIYDDDSLKVKHLDDGIIPLGYSVPDDFDPWHLSNFKFCFWYDDYFKNGYAIFKDRVSGTFNDPPKFGVIDDEGNVIIPPKYHNILGFVHGLSIVIGNHSLYGVINSKGAVVIPIKFDSIKQVEEESYSFIARSKSVVEHLNNEGAIVEKHYMPIIRDNNGLYGIVGGKSEDYLIPPEYDSITAMFAQGYKTDPVAFIVSKNGKKGLLNSHCEYMCKCEFDEIRTLKSDNQVYYWYRNGYGNDELFSNIEFRIGDRTGAFNKELQPIYDNRNGLNETFVVDGRVGIRLFETKKETYFPADGEIISPLGGGLFIVSKFKSDGKEKVYGVIDGYGRRITPFNGKRVEYNQAGYIVYYPYSTEDSIPLKPCLFNSSGELIINSIYDDIFLKNENHLTPAPIYGQYFRVSLSHDGRNKIGLIDITGKEVIPPIYSKIETLPVIKGFLIDSTIILNNRFELIGKLPQSVGYYYPDNNPRDKILLPFGTNKVRDCAILSEDGQLTILPSGYKYIEYANEDRIIVYEKERGYGYLNSNGEEVIPVKYNEVSSFVNGKARVRLDTEYGYIDKNGRVILDEKGTIVLPREYDWGWIYDEGMVVEKDGKYGYLDFEYNPIIPLIKNSKKELMKEVFITKGISHSDYVQPFIDDETGLFGFLSDHGEIIVPAIFEEIIGITKRSRYNNVTNPIQKTITAELIPVKYNALWGYVDDMGKTVIPFMFDKADSFKEGLAAVEINHKYVDYFKSYHGFINTQGKMVIDVDIKYKIESGFWKGKATIEINPCVPGKDNYWQDINKRGEYIDG